MSKNRTLISFEMSLTYIRDPRKGERFSLGESKHGPMMNYYLDGEHYKAALSDRDIDWLCEMLEKYMGSENQKHYSNVCALEGAHWRLEAKTDTETYECGGGNYYPEHLQFFFILLHWRFLFPWADIHRVFKTMDRIEPECIRVRIADEVFPLETFGVPEEVLGPTDPAFEAAKAIALEYDPEIDMYTEYEHAYIFSSTAYFGLIGPNPIIVMKGTGEAFPMSISIPDIGKELGPTRLFNGMILEDDEDK